MLDLLKVIIENGDYKKLLKDPTIYPANHIYYYYSKHNSDLFKRIYNNDKKNEVTYGTKDVIVGTGYHAHDNYDDKNPSLNPYL